MPRDWWIPILQWSLWGVTMTAVMGWAARSRFRKRSSTDRAMLAHPTSTLVIGFVNAVFSGGIAVISNTVGKNDSTTVWTTVAFLIFALISIPVIADYYFSRHRVSEAGMDYGRMFGKRGKFSWIDVRRVRYAETMKWFVLELHSGLTVRVSAMLTGLPEFARAVLAHVPKTAIDNDAFDVLRETECGRPPSLWR